MEFDETNYTAGFACYTCSLSQGTKDLQDAEAKLLQHLQDCEAHGELDDMELTLKLSIKSLPAVAIRNHRRGSQQQDP